MANEKTEDKSLEMAEKQLDIVDPPIDEAQTESWKPSKVVIRASVVLFLIVAVVDKILLDCVFREDPVPFIFAIIFFLDACGRLLLTSFLINWRDLFNKITKKTIIWVSFCRLGLQIGFLLGSISVKFIGGGTLNMMIQSQLLITGIFRYFIFKEKMSYNQTIYATAAVLGAFAFKSNMLDDKDANQGWKFGFGMILCGISCIVVSLFFALTEKLLKDILKQFVGWEKQFLFAMFDIPVMIIAVYMNILWEIYGCENDRSVNIFAGINFLCVATSINCVVFGVLLYFMFDWIDSIVVNVLFVIAMAFTWPVELILNFEKFYFSRLLILIFTVVCCIGYQFETVQRTKRKKLAASLMSKKEAEA